MTSELDVTRSTINRWLQCYEASGLEGLETGKAPGRVPSLTEAQRQKLVEMVEAGPLASGYGIGVWTGPIIRDLIAEKFGVCYHNRYIPCLLHYFKIFDAKTLESVWQWPTQNGKRSGFRPVSQR
jgi:transposase